MKRCPVCGCRIHVVRGTKRHYGSLVACNRIRRLRGRVEVLSQAVERLLAFEPSFGENDIPDEDRAFAAAALRRRPK